MILLKLGTTGFRAHPPPRIDGLRALATIHERFINAGCHGGDKFIRSLEGCWPLLFVSDGRTEIHVFDFPLLEPISLLSKWVVAYDVPVLASRNLKWAVNTV